MSRRPRPAGRAAFALNATVSVALLGLIAAVALVVKPAAPPGIAEFAPQAAKPITKAPQSQSSTNGDGSGACAEGQKCVGPSAKPSPKPAVVAVKDVLKGIPSALQCYTWPDGSVTQTFDPQSPPCVANWPEAAKGNGGSTSTGVSASEIRVAVPTDPESFDTKQVQPIVDFINTHYQLYGRKITIVPFTSQASIGGGDATNWVNPSAQHADAVQAASLKVFAATDFFSYNGNISASPSWFATLAQKKVLSLLGGNATPMSGTEVLARNAPYVWSYQQPIYEVMAASAHLVCKQLKGKLASHSGDFLTKTRKFGIYVPDQNFTGETLSPGIAQMRSILAGCGLSDVPVYYDPKNNRGAANTAALTQARSDGVTSLLWMTWVYAADGSDPLHTADKIRYNPEWFSMAWQAWYQAGYALLPTRQSSHIFGLASFNKYGPDSSLPWYQAFTAAGGKVAGPITAGPAFYSELAMLAAGIQMAGPKLTPATFAAAMHSTTFPNPGHGTAPTYQAEVGFPGTAVAMQRDYVPFWMDNSAGAAQLAANQGTLNPNEFFCYPDLGVRHSQTDWPTADHFYSGRCR